MYNKQTNELTLLKLAIEKFQREGQLFSRAEEGLLKSAEGNEVESNWVFSPISDFDPQNSWLLSTLEAFLPSCPNIQLPLQNNFFDFLKKRDLVNQAQSLRDNGTFTQWWDENIIPENGEKWLKDRTIRSDLIYWICRDKQARELIAPTGLNLSFRKISGDLVLDSLDIPFPLQMTCCYFSGNIRLPNATTKGLGLDGSCIQSLFADSISIKGSLSLKNGFIANGIVRLNGASVSGEWDCSGGIFNPIASDNHQDKSAIQADGINIKGNVYLIDGFKATKTVSLANAKIGGDLVCIGHNLHDEKSKVTSECLNLILERARIEKTLVLHSGFQINGDLDLVGATVGILADDKPCWPTKGHLYLNGFKYDRIEHISPRKAKSRLEWLSLMDKFFPGPYEQLANYYRKEGDKANEDKVNLELKRLTQKKEYYVLRAHRFFTGFGYTVIRPFWGSLIILTIGWAMFCFGNSNGLMVSTEQDFIVTSTQPSTEIVNSPDGQSFSPAVYSLDVFIPLVNFHQEEYWLPDSTNPCGCWLRIWLWLEISLGWYFSSVILSRLVRLVK